MRRHDSDIGDGSGEPPRVQPSWEQQIEGEARRDDRLNEWAGFDEDRELGEGEELWRQIETASEAEEREGGNGWL